MTMLMIDTDNEKSEKQLLDKLHAMGYSYRVVSTDNIPMPQARPSISSLFGSISKGDVELMEKAIEEGCEQTNPDDWK